MYIYTWRMYIETDVLDDVSVEIPGTSGDYEYRSSDTVGDFDGYRIVYILD